MTVKRATDEVGIHRANQKLAADKRPEVLRYLMETGLVGSQHKEAAEAMLATHAGTLDLVKLAAEELTKERAAVKAAARRDGEVVSTDTKQAGTGQQELNGGDAILLRILDRP